MIYRVMLASLLGTLSAIVICSAAVSERMAALVHRRAIASRGVTGLLERLLSRGTRRWSIAALVAGAFVSSWPGIVQYLSTGQVEMHWSRAMLSSLLVVVAVVLGVTSFLIHMLELVASAAAATCARCARPIASGPPGRRCARRRRPRRPTQDGSGRPNADASPPTALRSLRRSFSYGSVATPCWRRASSPGLNRPSWVGLLAGSARVRSRGPRSAWTLALATLLVALAALELFSCVALRASEGRWVGLDDLAAARARSGAGERGAAPLAEPESGRPAREGRVLHPFLGYVMDPRLAAPGVERAGLDPLSVELGFPRNREPLLQPPDPGRAIAACSAAPSPTS